jgi:hypothetical protein
MLPVDPNDNVIVSMGDGYTRGRAFRLHAFS